eukprot:14171355-Alexandrium_andersonii.AAC.1
MKRGGADAALREEVLGQVAVVLDDAVRGPIGTVDRRILKLGGRIRVQMLTQPRRYPPRRGPQSCGCRCCPGTPSRDSERGRQGAPTPHCVRKSWEREQWPCSIRPAGP